jgi:hypothetical protein
VEDGYLTSKYSGRYDWVSKSGIDPSKSSGGADEDFDAENKHLLNEMPLKSDQMLVNEFIQARKVVVKEKSKS